MTNEELKAMTEKNDPTGPKSWGDVFPELRSAKPPTHDERIIAELEARVRGTFEDGMTHGRISREDLDTLLNSRLAWKFTAKCFSAERT